MNFSSASIRSLSSGRQLDRMYKPCVLTGDTLLGAHIRLDGDDGARAGFGAGLPRSLFEGLETSASDVHLDTVVGERISSDEAKTGPSARHCCQRPFCTTVTGPAHQQRPSRQHRRAWRRARRPRRPTCEAPGQTSHS